MLRVLPLIAYFAFFIYTLVAVIQTPDEGHKHLPKMGWMMLVIVIPLVGGLCWWLIGRKVRGPLPRPDIAPRPQRPPRPKGPDDDPDFLKNL